MIWWRYFFQNISLIMLNNFCHDKHCLKIKSRWRNRRSSQKLLKKGKMTAVWRHTSKTGHDIKRKFIKCFSDHAGQPLPWLTLLKNQVKVTKQEMRSKNWWKTAKWRLYDDIPQSRDMIWKSEFFHVSLIILETFTMTNIALKSIYSA